jgi:hypothetical protein
MAANGVPGFSLQCRSLDAQVMIDKFTDLERHATELRQTIAGSNSMKVKLVAEQLASMSAVLLSWKLESEGSRNRSAYTAVR